MQQSADDDDNLYNHIDRKKIITQYQIEELNAGGKAQSYRGERCKAPQEKNHVETELHVFEQNILSVSVPSKKDILFGRGKSIYNNPGNILLRDIVGKNFDAYKNASQRSKKSEIVRAVVDDILETGARFLKKQKDRPYWQDVGFKVAQEKVRTCIQTYSFYSKGRMIIMLHALR